MPQSQLAAEKISFVSLDSVATDGRDNNFANIEKIAAPDGDQDNSAAIDLLETVKADYTGTARRGIEALELKIKGYSGTEIAEMYGVKPNLVGAWISRASQKLRQNERFTDELKDIA